MKRLLILPFLCLGLLAQPSPFMDPGSFVFQGSAAVSDLCDTLSQYNDNAADGGGTAIIENTHVRAGTRFTATNSMTVCLASVRIYAQSGAETSDVKLELYTDNSNAVGTLLGTSETLPGNTLPVDAADWIDFDFTTPVTLTNSAIYWVVVYRPTPARGLGWMYNNSGIEHIVKGDAGSWTDVSTSRAARYRLYE